MTYVMLAINGKEIDDNIYVRRVLLRYETKETAPALYRGVFITKYLGTKLLAVDDYFKDKTKNNQYSFYDDYYVLTSTNYWHNKGVEGDERLYHSISGELEDRYYKHLAPIEFEASSDKAAIKKFNKRNELR